MGSRHTTNEEKELKIRQCSRCGQIMDQALFNTSKSGSRICDHCHLKRQIKNYKNNMHDLLFVLMERARRLEKYYRKQKLKYRAQYHASKNNLVK